MNRIDIAVGGRIRAYRKALGMSQTELADRIGVRFQQVQKYENGSNRVAASRLWQIADALNVSITTLFKDVASRPATPAESSEFLDLYRQLDDLQRPALLAHMRRLVAEFPNRSGLLEPQD